MKYIDTQYCYGGIPLHHDNIISTNLQTPRNYHISNQSHKFWNQNVKENIGPSW